MNNKYYRCVVCHKFPDINEDWNFFSYNYKGIICKSRIDSGAFKYAIKKKGENDTD